MRKTWISALGVLTLFLQVISQNFAIAYTGVGYSSSAVLKFTGNETWTVPYGVSSIDLLAVGGGGGGGTDGGNGGGGGEVRQGTGISVAAGNSYAIVIGSGGAGSSHTPSSASSAGTATTITGTGIGYTANGGAAATSWSPSQNIAAGGTGGGGGTGSPGGSGGVNRYQQNEGIGGAGSDGPTSTIPTGSAVNFGGGGGGGSCWSTKSSNTASGALGGAGGGGQGAGHTVNVGSPAGSAGTANTGGGGGGGSACDGGTTNGTDQRTKGGDGAAGVVYIRFTLSAPTTPNMTAATDSGYSNSDDRTNNTTPVFTGTSIGGSTIQLQSDGVNTGNTCTADSSSGTWSCTAGSLTSGSHLITAVATLGGISSTSTNLTVVIDNVVPTLSSTVSNVAGTQVTFTFNETLNTYSIPVDSFTVTVLGTKDTVTAASASSATVVLTLTFAIPIGASPTVSYTKPGSFQVNTIQDLAGNEAATISAQAITNNATATAASSLTYSISGATTKQATVTITATVTSAITPSGTVTFYDNGKAITRCVNKTLSGSVATCSWKILVQGQRAISAKFIPTYPNSVDSSSLSKYLIVGKRTGAR